MSTAIRVLIVEDSESDALLLAHLLEREGYQPTLERVDAPEAMRAALVARPWDLILAKDSLPGFSALDALALLRELELDVPFIVVWDTSDEAMAASALRAGAHDFIVKGNWARLGPAIARELRVAEERRQRQRAEQALIAGEERFRALIENSADGIVLLDANGVVQLDTPASASRILGYSSAELAGCLALDLVHPEDLENVSAALGEIIGSRAIMHAQFRVKHKDGSWRWMEAVGANLLDMPAVGAIVINVRDITERKQAEKALAESERRYRTLFESVPEIVYTLSFDGVFTLLNPAFESTTGWSRQEWIGKHFEELFHPDDRQMMRQEFGRAIQGQTNTFREVRVRTRVGETLVMEMLGVAQVQSGQTVGVTGFAHDVTQRKRAEAASRRRLTELVTVHQVSSALRVAENEEQALPILLDQILAALEAEAGVIYLYDSTDGVLRAAVARGWLQDLANTPIKPGEGIAGAVFASGQAHVTLDYVHDPLTHPLVKGRITSGWGGACLPIRSAAETIGVILVCVRSPREISPEDMRLLESLAEMAGTSLHRMRLHLLTEQRLQRLIALRAVDQAISASVDLRLTLGILVDQVIAQLRPDAAEVLLLDPIANVLNYAAGHGFRTNLPEQAHVRLGQLIAGQVALERRVMTQTDFRPEEQPADLSRFLAAEGFVAFTGVPLIAKGRVHGVLEVFHRTAFHPSADWLDFLEALAGQAAIAIDNALLFEGLQRSNASLVLAYDATIEGWSRAMDLRDKETEGHTRRVAELTVLLARRLGIPEEEIMHIRRGALLHDIGKIGVPDAILSKPGPLTNAERAIMQEHPVLAYEMLAPIAYLRPALDIPYCHHEKWDGTGYPRGLRGEEIPLAARIFAVADVWDALRSDRPYRPAWPEAQVRAHIRALSGTHLDPRLVTAFLQLARVPE